MKYTYNDIKINYEVIGKGNPILFIHGYMVDKSCMVNRFESFIGNNYKKYYIDLPHMGDSNWPSSINSSDDYLDIVLRFMSDVISEKCAVVGYSFGGYLVRGIQEKIDTIGGLLVCPVQEAYIRNRTLPKHRVFHEDNFCKNLDAENFKSTAVIQTKETYTESVKDYVKPFKKANRKHLDNLFENNYEFSFEFKKTVNEPVLTLLGRHDNVVGYKDFYKYDHLYKNLSLVVLNEAGHSLMIEQEKLFQVHTLNWLNSLKW